MSLITIDGYKLACFVKPGGPTGIVFLHGLGASKRSFDPLFQEKALKGYTLASIDLPGCGDSSHPDRFSYTMKDQAGLVLKWIGDLKLAQVVLVGHSMGGVICLHLAESLKTDVGAFLNLEGNLGYEDCTFSKLAASMGQQDFERRGYIEFKNRLKNSLKRSFSPGLQGYYQNISKADPGGFYLSSLSLVQESRHGNLKERFCLLPVKKWYIFGAKSMNPSSRAFLERQGVPYYVVPESGHFMMDDQPHLFRDILVEAVQYVG
jgi:pimeloyl-ACP methyl ester carboxylesterase